MMTDTPTSRPDGPTDLTALSEAILALRDVGEAERFLRDLLTPGEMKTLTERWRVAGLLAEGGHSYREISDMTGASTTTVTRVARFLSQEPWQGYRTILNRLKEGRS